MANDSEITKLKKKLNQLKSDLKDKSEILAETEKKLDLKDKDLVDVKGDLDKKDEEINQLKSDLKDKSEKIDLKDKDLEECISNLQRLQADFENFKKQNEKHNKEIIKFANEKLIMNILDIYEDLERALNQSKNMDELKEGVELIYSKFKSVLEKEGLKEIETEGVKFDTFKHEALMVEDKGDCENGMIIEELMKGYTLKDKVIKYSKVKVCKKNKK